MSANTNSTGEIIAGGASVGAGLAAFWGKLTGIGGIRRRVAVLENFRESDSKALTEVRVGLAALPTKEDLNNLALRLEAGMDRVTAAGEARVKAIHERLDRHIERKEEA